MQHWGAGCPKRTSTWSNDWNVIHKLAPAPDIDHDAIQLINQRQIAPPIGSIAQDLGPLNRVQMDQAEIVTTCQELNHQWQC